MRGFIYVQAKFGSGVPEVIRVDAISSVSWLPWNKARIHLYDGRHIDVTQSVEQVFAAMRQNS